MKALWWGQVNAQITVVTLGVPAFIWFVMHNQDLAINVLVYCFVGGIGLKLVLSILNLLAKAFTGRPLIYDARIDAR